MTIEFEAFPKIARLNRDCVISEKIDGTNACVIVGDDGEFAVASRTKIITPMDDNHGFAKWAYLHKEELVAKLGPGRHFGEWWGAGIQRKYGLTGNDKAFSLFNTDRWGDMNVRPSCCRVVPVLFEGPFTSWAAMAALKDLRLNGSKAAPSFMKPEGIVIWHIAARTMFKVTLEKDEKPKGMAA